MSKPKIKTGTFERRTINHKVEIRKEGDQGIVYGYAAKFNEESELLGDDWVEVIEEGFFDEVLDDDVRCLFNHDSNLVLARNKATTLTLTVDSIGLRYEYTTPDITYAKDLAESIRLGNVSQNSFGFTTKETEWKKIENEDNSIKWTRHLVKCKKLYDVGPVTYPAYTTTEVAVRSFNDFKSKNIAPPKKKKPKKETKSKKDKKAVRQRHLRLLELS